MTHNSSCVDLSLGKSIRRSKEDYAYKELYLLHQLMLNNLRLPISLQCGTPCRPPNIILHEQEQKLVKGSRIR